MHKHKNILILSGNGMMGNTILKYLNTKPQLNIFYTIRNSKKIVLNKNYLIIKNLFEKKNYLKLKNFLEEKKISLIINCSGVTKHKSNQYQKKYSLKINFKLNHKLSKIKNIKLLILSSDCVFDGKNGNYEETSKNYSTDLYGKTKRLGEIKNLKNVITFRSSGIGHEINDKKGLLEWFLKNKSKKVYGYTNAFFSGPTTLEIAKIIYKYVISKKIKYGLFHISSRKISKYNILNIIKKIYKKKISIIKNEDFKIDRSLNSNKFKKKTNYISPYWLDLIKETKLFNEKFS